MFECYRRNQSSLEDEEGLVAGSTHSRSIRSFHHDNVTLSSHLPEVEESRHADVRAYSNPSTPNVLRLTTPRDNRNWIGEEEGGYPVRRDKYRLQVPEVGSPRSRQATAGSPRSKRKTLTPITQHNAQALPPIHAPRSPRNDVTSNAVPSNRDASSRKADQSSMSMNPNQLRINLGYQSNVSASLVTVSKRATITERHLRSLKPVTAQVSPVKRATRDR